MTTVSLASLGANAPTAAQGQLWVANEIGGYWYSDNLSSYLRQEVQPRCRFRQFADLPEDTQNAKHAGDTFHWNVYGDLDDAGTDELAEEDTIPHGRLQAQQGKCVVTEFGYGVPYSGKLDDLSLHPVRDIIRQALKRRAAKKLDTRAYQQFGKSLLKVVPGSGGASATDVEITENGTPASANDSPLTAAHLRSISTQMRERDIPTYDHGDYYSVARPTTYAVVESDLENIQQYTEAGFKLIRDGEKGRYAGIRMVEQTNIAVQFASTTKSDEAFFFGEDAVAECVVIPEEIRGKIPDDYGRGKGVAYYYLGNFAPTRLKASDTRVMHWASA